MAKLTANQKTAFTHCKEGMKGVEFEFKFNRKLGISILAVFTGPLKTHYKIIVSHCGENDEFKKKIGFTECVMKYVRGGGVVLKVFENTHLDILIDEFAECLLDILPYELETF